MRKYVLITNRRGLFFSVWFAVACGTDQTGDSETDMSMPDMTMPDMARARIPVMSFALPDCSPGQFLMVGAGASLSCAGIASAVSPPQCPPNTHVLNASNGVLSCVPKGSGSADATVLTAINRTAAETTTLVDRVNALSLAGARYCGNTTGTFSGRISSGGVTGLAAASALCAQVAACGTGSHMCTVYEMFESVSKGVLTSAMTLGKSWVYMASWQSFSAGAVEPTAGQNDNCGSYTHAGTGNNWYGTAVRWENSAAGDRVLKFFTGPDQTGIGSPVGNYEGARCDATLPIACCK